MSFSLSECDGSSHAHFGKEKGRFGSASHETRRKSTLGEMRAMGIGGGFRVVFIPNVERASDDVEELMPHFAESLHHAICRTGDRGACQMELRHGQRSSECGQ